MKNLVVLSGVAGVGKSTFVHKLVSEWRTKGKNVSVVSRDEIRFFLVKPNEPYFSKEDKVFNTFIQQIMTDLEKYEVVIVDATHINTGSRKKLMKPLMTFIKQKEAAKAMEVRISAYQLRAPLSVALRQNELREGTRGYVPIEVISNMYYSLTKPIPEEGFDEIHIMYKDEVEKDFEEVDW